MEVFPASLRASSILLSYTPYRVSHKEPESPLQGCLMYVNSSEISVVQRHSWQEAESKVGHVPISSRISLSMKIISEKSSFNQLVILHPAFWELITPTNLQQHITHQPAARHPCSRGCFPGRPGEFSSVLLFPLFHME